VYDQYLASLGILSLNQVARKEALELKPDNGPEV
jgi:hypothetical protein